MDAAGLKSAISQFLTEHGKDPQFRRLVPDLQNVQRGLSQMSDRQSAPESPGRQSAQKAMGKVPPQFAKKAA